MAEGPEHKRIRRKMTAYIAARFPSAVIMHEVVLGGRAGGGWPTCADILIVEADRVIVVELKSRFGLSGLARQEKCARKSCDEFWVACHIDQFRALGDALVDATGNVRIFFEEETAPEIIPCGIRLAGRPKPPTEYERFLPANLRTGEMGRAEFYELMRALPSPSRAHRDLPATIKPKEAVHG